VLKLLLHGVIECRYFHLLTGHQRRAQVPLSQMEIDYPTVEYGLFIGLMRALWRVPLKDAPIARSRHTRAPTSSYMEATKLSVRI
jgi:hypothetical protein